MAFTEGQREKLRAILLAEPRIRNNLSELERCNEMKSTFTERPFTLKRFKKFSEEDDVLEELNNRNFTNRNPHKSSDLELLKILGDCYRLLACLNNEVFVMRWTLTRDIIRAYVRNCYDKVKHYGVDIFDLQKLFPLHEVNLRNKVGDIHKYTNMIKEQQPGAYISQLEKYPSLMLKLHGVERVEDEMDFRAGTAEFLQHFGCRATHQLPVDWSSIGMMLMLVANAVCDMIHKNYATHPDHTRDRVRAILDVAAQNSECFLANQDNWQALGLVTNDYVIPEIPDYTFMKETHQKLPSTHPGDLFDYVTSINSPNFGGAIQAPRQLPTLLTLCFQMIPGNTKEEKCEYIDESIIHSGHNPDDFVFPWNC